MMLEIKDTTKNRGTLLTGMDCSPLTTLYMQYATLNNTLKGFRMPMIELSAPLILSRSQTPFW
jgi:hypothetical protein